MEHQHDHGPQQRELACDRDDPELQERRRGDDTEWVGPDVREPPVRRVRRGSRGIHGEHRKPIERQHDGRHPHRDDDHDKGDGNDPSNTSCIESEQIGRSGVRSSPSRLSVTRKPTTTRSTSTPTKTLCVPGSPMPARIAVMTAIARRPSTSPRSDPRRSATGALGRAIIGRPVPGLASSVVAHP